jgi:protein-S-isoprenylcysteine O-methyltransferase Ste14
MVALGYWLIYLVFRANTFAASTIELAGGQTVISTGPYCVVRHPMYSASLILFAGVPLALGSWWGLIPAALMAPLLAWRLTVEEAFLVTHLNGYDAYRSKVRWRLVPLVW